MERKTLKEFHKQLSWSTRIYTLMVLLTAIFAFALDAFNTNWVLTILVTLSIILFVESYAISFHRHPKTWRNIRLFILLILLALLLIGWKLVNDANAWP